MSQDTAAGWMNGLFAGDLTGEMSEPRVFIGERAIEPIKTIFEPADQTRFLKKKAGVIFIMPGFCNF